MRRSDFGPRCVRERGLDLEAGASGVFAGPGCQEGVALMAGLKTLLQRMFLQDEP